MKFTANATLENPLRDIILNRDQLLRHAAEIAQFHLQVGITHKHRRIMPRFIENTKFLKRAYYEISEYVQRTRDIVPAAEWFLDNYYLLKDSQLEIRKNFSWRYERQLPRVAGGDFEGFPRIYALMVEFVEHTDSEISADTLIEFVNDYQRHIPLTTGELWAIPAILKIILIENIRRLVEQILRTQEERQAAEELIAAVFGPSGELVSNWRDVLERAEGRDGYTPEFAERLLQRIREHGVEGAPVLRWFERDFRKYGLNLEALAKLEHQRQAACQVSMGHAILSLRFIAEENWAEFFEATSTIEKALAEDPSGVYAQMDFVSRDKYRQEVEKIARHYKVAESVVVRHILNKANEADSLPQNHVGYYLLGEGRADLEKELENEWGRIRQLWCEIKRFICNQPNAVYFGLLAFSNLVLLYATVKYSGLLMTDLHPLGLAGFIIILLLALSAIAVPFTNWVITSVIPPAFLPKLELRNGIPAELKTIVVVPALLTDVDRVKELLRQIEIYYLANQDPHLHFAILGDYRDHKEQVHESDREIVETAKKGIEELNQKYGAGTFFFFHRDRQWNEAESVWMGWERKRGKLLEFNRLLLGDSGTSYTIKVGDLSVLSQIKYVITLDADTQLPRGAAKRLIGAIAHPLQHPVIDPGSNRVVKGYGVLQPRVAVSFQSASASLFARLFAGQAGIDPYTTAVSDIYQDLYGEGIFTGKGIYDLKAFHQVTDQAFPENAILSHDLIEGIYARAGLVSDIELIDGYPAKYLAFSRRAHRWIRGDWQLLKWVFKPLPWQARWKIIDNLRRSLEAPALLALAAIGWTVSSRPWLWTALVAFILFWPSLLTIANCIIGNKSQDALVCEVRDRLLQFFFQFAVLPHQAYTSLDAIIRSLYRQFVSHRKLLEWETAADTDRRTKVTLAASARSMWFTGVFIAFLAWSVYRQGMLLNALPVLAIWAASPWMAYYFSRPQSPQIIKEQQLSESDRLDMRLWARKIWAFFEDYVTEKDHWLPPDNVQIDPPNGIAHRTSPTNIGLNLLANLTAWDLGYITSSELLRRISNTLDTIGRLDHWNGHLYNWYDTLTLKPLNPLYVSTVDSGNLVVYYITLEQGLKDLEKRPAFGKWLSEGLIDTALLLLNHIVRSGEAKQAANAFIEEARQFEIEFNLGQWYAFLRKWKANGIKSRLSGEEAEARYWAFRLEQMLEAYTQELEQICPWIKRPEIAEAVCVRLSQMCEGRTSLTSDFDLALPELLQRYSELQHSAELPADVLEEIGRAAAYIDGLLDQAKNLRAWLRQAAYATDFSVLFDPQKQLFSIGYRLSDGELDKSYYDLLASEARQASFIAIAKGDVPQSHWFKLGRALTSVRGRKGLVSWSGTMFEFLMPLIVMKNYPFSLLDVTYRTVVEIQRKYGMEKRVPWGISESGFYAFDAQLNYQYKAFGVPGLGLKRGLIQDLVIAPYATFLALLVEPVAALANLRQMRDMGFDSRYGFYEAIDFTPERLPAKESYRIVKSYMVHHQGMSLLALGNVLTGNILQERFHAERVVQATELLLQEKLPSDVMAQPQPEGQQMPKVEDSSWKFEEASFLTFSTAQTVHPVTHLLSNGDYSVMITNSGAGYSCWHNLAVSRWRDDATRDSWGMYFYIQNLNSGAVWSATYQPLKDEGENYVVTYSPDRVEFCRKDGNIITRTEIFVSAEDPVEIRRISLTNQSQYQRILEVTSYFEVVLGSPSADLAHPAFSNLFIQTEYDDHALLASRRPRSDEEPRYWLMHTVAVEGETVGVLEYETDRSRFIGRGRDLSNPQVLELNKPLSNTVGAVLDPIMSLRQRVMIPPGKTVRLSFSVGVGASREDVVRLAQKYRNPASINRAREMAWTHSQMELRHLHLSPTLANEALNLAGHLLYLSPVRREYAEVIKRNTKSQPDLWPYAISGDLPIVVALVKEAAHLNLVRQLVAVHEYWRLKGLATDLVIINEDKSGYVQSFQEMLRDVVTLGQTPNMGNKAGGIFILQKSHMTSEDLTLLLTVARVVFTGEEGNFGIQMRRKLKLGAGLADDVPSVPVQKIAKGGERSAAELLEVVAHQAELDAKSQRDELLMYNGFGGFSKDGKEYVITLKAGMNTPLPWLNVIANPQFGFQVSESGGGYTWSQNSRENKLTSWSNDPIVDPPSEVVYIKDLDTMALWSVTPQPIRTESTYTVRHGQGYSIFEHRYLGIHHELLMFVPIKCPLKILKLKLRNLTGSERNLQLTYYVEWVLGVIRDQTAPFIVTEYDEKLQVLKARNVYQDEFAGRVAFMAASGVPIASYSGDRRKVLGRNQDLRRPQGILGELDQQVGAGLDPCGAIQVNVKLMPGGEKEICFFLGEARDEQQLASLVQEFRDPRAVDEAYGQVLAFWDRFLSIIQINTPDDSMNLLVNRWLLYQTLACRLWARSAFYQSGGAYGFRDQLQDVMALVVANPALAREQILKHCARQFVEGDVQHWWHPERGKGIRTKFSDDLLWLPFVTLDYLEHTGDYSVLDEVVPFLEDAPLGEDEDERYSIPRQSEESGTVYEHCIRAIERSLKFGEHGLPLIGTGDWNDGFSRIGRKGKGESVWLGWFLLTILKKIAPLCQMRGEEERAKRYLEIADQLNLNLESHGWDGGWYRRAYFDDGTPLGSRQNAECQIDAIAQSWAVISGGARRSRAEDAMLALEHYLLKREDRMLLLLTPPFDEFKPDPGYIKGYVPGVRENGGQYTHGAIWAIIAYALMGKGELAAEVFHILNPINHTRTEGEVARYKAEPYVMAADVYANAPHAGRGGWTWYTGAAGWMYQAAIEGILGFKLKDGDKVELAPCIPSEWDGYTIDFRYRSTIYKIRVLNPHGKSTGIRTLRCDGEMIAGNLLQLIDDGRTHEVIAEM